MSIGQEEKADVKVYDLAGNCIKRFDRSRVCVFGRFGFWYVYRIRIVWRFGFYGTSNETIKRARLIGKCIQRGLRTESPLCAFRERFVRIFVSKLY